MRTAIWLSCAILTIAGNTSRAQEGRSQPWWPQFRGPATRGIAADGLYPTEFGPETNVIWKVAVPPGVSSPCIWQDRIFITAHDPARQVLETLCLDRANGSILWRKDAPAEEIESVHEVSSPANATPATDGKRVYVYFASCGLICYDFDGTELWKVPLPLRPSRFGSGTSPVVVDDLVVLNRDEWPAIRRTEQGGFEPGESDAHILAVHAADGTTAWDTKRPGSFVFYSTPVVWRGPQGTQVLLMGSSRLTSYDVKTGKELWWVNELPPQVCATPQVNDTHVYLTATGMFGEPDTFLGLPDFATFLQQHDQDGDGQIAISEIPADFVVVDRRASGGAGNSPLTMFAPGMDRNQDQKIDQQEWKGFDAGVGTFIKNAPQGVYAIRLGGEGDVTKTNIQWHVTRGVTEVPSLLVLSDRMFLVRNGGIVHCRDLETGQDLYQGRLGAVGGYYASPVLAGGNVYFASDRGAVTVIAAHTPRLEVLARNDLQEPIMATPAPLEGRLYVRTAAHLYAFGQ